MNEFTHLSLFSGIGGLDLAAERAGFKTIGQCEYADYPYQVLRKHWPDVPKWRDIHELSTNEFLQKTGQRTATVVSGGFPCQPHSLAGKRKASADERDLWPAFRRVISEIKPKWVVAENVRGLLSSEDGRFFRDILRDFADMGYDVGWCTFPAAAVGAIHKRDRMAIVAYSSSIRRDSMDKSVQDGLAKKLVPVRNEWACQENSTLPYVSRLLHPPISGVLRNDDGISKGMDRLKGLGNAVVPQQFYPIFQAIAEIES